jgi:hypothetical protein
MSETEGVVMEASGTRIDASKVIGEAFNTYGKYFGPLIGGAVILIGIAGLINGILRTTDSLILVLIGSIISLVATVLYTGYVVKLVQDVRDGRLDQDMSELFSAATPYIGTLILNGILYGIAVFFGFLALIVPGLILITIWAVVAPAIVVENQGVIDAFGRSRELVRGNGWNVFFAVLLAFLILAAVYIVLGGLGFGIGDDAGGVVGSVIANVIAAPVTALVSSILFFDLGGGTEAAAASEPTAPA